MSDPALSPSGARRKRDFLTPLAITAVSLILTFFHLYTAGVSMLTAWIQRDIHLVLILIIVFLALPARRGGERNRATILDWVLIALALASGSYIVVNYQDIVQRLGAPNTSDIVFGIIMIGLILEATRRATGWVLVIIAGTFLLYNFIGPYIPGLLGHKGYSVSRVVSQMYLTTEGIFGVPLGVSASYIFLFIFLTSMLEKLGMGDFLLKLAMALMGRFAGGPAKTAVLASGFMGSISGSAVANVVGTGTFTIPLMKRNGYQPHFAGAVEACASSGGQLMPPIMGAAAFIIAEFLGIPYINVVVAAIIPALLYYLCVLFGVHFEACRLGLTGLPREQLPNAWKVLREGGHFLIPLVVLVYFLAVLQYTPIRSGFYAIIAMFIVSFFNKETRINWSRFKEGAVAAAQNTCTVALACAAAGLVIGSINITGAGLKISSFIVALSAGTLWLALLMTAVVALIMGMGLPTTAAYIVTGTMAAPALIKLGVLPLAAHLFVFYFAIISAITPPVALAAYAAAGIAKDDPMRIGFTACKIGLAAFIVPFMFAYEPTLIAEGDFWHIAWAVLTAVIGVMALAGSTIGFVVRAASVPERAMLLAGSLMTLYPGIYTDIIGLILIALALGANIIKGKKLVGKVSARSFIP
ncbi:TRAP transporter permease [Desulfofundulus thermocisternus]|uniref:TRAP transporter permease n=1 Tax=Desulfofundulus thermocisternus TaxID=42471 RepID=UPI00047FC582|nr:TRAP transporter permease [Desulfofundulus thermocisternus]